MTNRLGRLGMVAISAALMTVGLVAGQGTGSGGGGAAPRDAFFGVWRLVSFENIDEQGRRTPAGFDEGRIMYDAQGNMAAQLMRSNRAKNSSPPTDTERSASYATYVAYYGTYSLDAATSKVTHHVAGALNPNWVKTELIRYWEFSPDRSRLSLSIRNAAGRTTGTLLWERVH